MTLFLISSHRPVDVHNIYNQIQVMLLMKQDDLDEAPDFDDVFREDEVNYFILFHPRTTFQNCDIRYFPSGRKNICTAATSFICFSQMKKTPAMTVIVLNQGEKENE